MSFKDDLAADLDVFFNTDEFAEVIEVNGVVVNGVLSALKVDPLRSIGVSAAKGMQTQMMTLSIRNADIPSKLYIGCSITVRKREYIVEDIQESSGITKLLLSGSGAVA